MKCLQMHPHRMSRVRQAKMGKCVPHQQVLEFIVDGGDRDRQNRQYDRPCRQCGRTHKNHRQAPPLRQTGEGSLPLAKMRRSEPGKSKREGNHAEDQISLRGFYLLPSEKIGQEKKHRCPRKKTGYMSEMTGVSKQIHGSSTSIRLETSCGYLAQKSYRIAKMAVHSDAAGAGYFPEPFREIRHESENDCSVYADTGFPSCTVGFSLRGR